MWEGKLYVGGASCPDVGGYPSLIGFRCEVSKCVD